MVEQKLKVTLLTGRTIEQGVGKEKGKGSKEYFEACSMCFMDADDMKKLGVKNNTNILVSTPYGSVVLKAVKYPRGATPGLIYIPYGPWANAICSDETYQHGHAHRSRELQLRLNQPQTNCPDHGRAS